MPGGTNLPVLGDLDRGSQTPYPYDAYPLHSTEARPTPRRHAPLFGEHNREILCGLLGVPEDELAGREEARIIGDAPIGAGVG